MKGEGSNKYLVFTAFACGSIVMVVELIGSRVIGPPFGVSLFVWTSLITVTLVSLALGYWLGGRLADRYGSHGALFTVIFLAGLSLLAVPVIKGTVIGLSLSLGLRAGSLVSSTVLFGPPLFLLGMVAPYTVKLYMGDGRDGIGRTVGWLYAVSTAGSFVGTVSTGFILIPNIGVNNIIYLSSASLILIGALYWLLFRRKAYALAVVAVPLVLLLFPKDLPSVVRPDGTKAALVVNEDSAYGQIKVVDYTYGDQLVREFLLENMIQGAVDLRTGLSVSKYTYYIEKLSRAYNPSAKRALVIGLGSGIVPNRLHKLYGIKTDVVEINPSVVLTAARYFAYDKSLHPTFIEDGRYFLNASTEPYDIIVLDAFSGDTPPSHLISLEAFKLVRKRLAVDGVLIINFVGSNMPEDLAAPSSLLRTLKEVFPRIDVYTSVEYSAPAPRVVNMIFAATLVERPINDSYEARVHPAFEEDVRALLSRKIELPLGETLFTDDFNPVDFQDFKTRERFRFSVIATSDREIVLD
ncbi:MAG: fused MFS/spermidine synthase [Deltaproteobacteria bacterium]|nr:fused MFS/spermidine synthase [Deltaproteobacteria bacterium]